MTQVFDRSRRCGTVISGTHVTAAATDGLTYRPVGGARIWGLAKYQGLAT